MSRVHVVGAGIAGLAAAERLSAAGRPVVLHEAASRAGGRCRSYFDPRLGRVIDNGSHLILSGNRTVLGLIASAGAGEHIRELRPARFPFLDLASGARWTLAPGLAALFESARLPPDVGPWGLAFDMFRLARSGPDDAVGDRLDIGSARFARLWEPLARAVLNVEAATGSASGLWAVVRETLAKGEAASRPILAPGGLSAAIAEPVVALLRAREAEVRFGARLRAIETTAGRVETLDFAQGRVAVAPGDAVVLAVPAAVAAALLGQGGYPDAFSAIINIHYLLEDGDGLDPELPFLGLLGGTAEWLFQRDDVISVSVSAGNRLLDERAEDLAAEIWRDVATALGRDRGEPPPPYRVVKERRATIVQTPAMERRRPRCETRFENLVLAGDWTATALPGTIEGAARSGQTAAEALLREARGPTLGG